MFSEFAERERSRIASADKRQHRKEKLRMVSKYGGRWYSRESKMNSLAFHHRRRIRFVETTFVVELRILSKSSCLLRHISTNMAEKPDTLTYKPPQK